MLLSSSRLFYSGVFLISGCLMALQILQSRIFSVTTWYHLAFLVISIAMFGMTLAALHIHEGDREKQENNYGALMADGAEKLALYIVIALLAQLFLPIVHENFIGTVFSLPLLSFLTVLPYYQAGRVLTLALTRTPYSVARTYGIDLIGAAAGCVAALVLMESMDAPSAVLCIAILACSAALCFASLQKNLFKTLSVKIFMVIVAGMVIWNISSPKPLIYPVWIKSHLVKNDNFTHDEWNTISRVTVSREYKEVFPFLWGPSPRTPQDLRGSFYELRIDGDAGTPINYFDGNKETIKALEFDVVTLAYALPGIDKVGIIGVGGGRDVLTAHYFGAREITALDVNDIQISLLTEKEPYKSYAGLTKISGLQLIHSEARSWFSQNDEKFDLIQMSLIDTWAATGAGAFALSENGLYTTDAWKIFLDDLDESGVFTVSRWYVAEMTSETERLLSLAVQSLFEMGVDKPRDHIVMAISKQIATLILSRTPFTEEQLAALRRQADEKGFNIAISPNANDVTDVFDKILSAENPDALERLADQRFFDISPPDDNRPFFFNQIRLGNPFEIITFIREHKDIHLPGQAHASLNLYMIIVFALGMVVFAILVPLYDGITHSAKSFIYAGTSWFLLIGLGFMLLEVALLQRMSIFLGHPVYGLSIVLFSLVLSAGLGSLLSGRFPLADSRKRAVWIVATVLLIAGLAAGVGSIFEAFAELPLFYRAVICVALAVPLGLMLGYGFPTGMMLVEAIDNRPTAWFWGINGAAGVMGSALAIAFNISLGLNWTIMLGGLCYALLILPSLAMARLKNSP